VEKFAGFGKFVCLLMAGEGRRGGNDCGYNGLKDQLGC
jgi:hypothetical protein